MNFSSRKQAAAHEQSGAVVLFFAVVLIAIISLAALSMDSFRLFTSHTEKLLTSDYAALASLKTYLYEHADAISPPLNLAPLAAHQSAMDSARQRALEIARSNRMTSTGAFHATGSDSLTLGDSPSGNDVGSILAGRWVPEGACYAGLPNQQTAPCFEACPYASGCLNSPSGDTQFANAMLVTLRTHPRNPITNFFAGAAFPNQDRATVGAGGTSAEQNSTIAMLAPRHIVLAMDASAFTTFGGTPLQFGLRERSGPPNDFLVECVDAGCTSARPYTPTSSAGYTTVTNGGKTYRYFTTGANPLNTMRQTVYDAIQFFTDPSSGVSELDKLAIVTFDGAVHQAYTTPPTSLRRDLLLRRNNPDLTTDIQPLFANLQNAIGVVHFPRSQNRADVSVGRVLREARLILSDDPYVDSSSNHIMLLTTGMMTCNGPPIPSDGVWDEPPGWTPTCIDLTAPAATQFAQHEGFMQELIMNSPTQKGEIMASLRPESIRLHTVLFDGGTVPHTVLIPDRTGPGCLDDREIRESALYNVYWTMPTADPMVMQGFIDIGKVPQPGYAYPNFYLYSAVRALRGTWGPVRERCTDLLPSATFPNIPAALNGRCDAGEGALPSPNTINPTVPNYMVDVRDMSAAFDSSYYRLVCNPPDVTVTPPADLTPPDQALDYFKDLFSKRALLLVAPEK